MFANRTLFGSFNLCHCQQLINYEYVFSDANLLNVSRKGGKPISLEVESKQKSEVSLSSGAM